MTRITKILPWLIIWLPSMVFVAVLTSLSMHVGWRPEFEYHDLVAECFLIVILSIWVRNASVLRRKRSTYWIFISGAVCMIWVMVMKMTAEVSLADYLILRVLEAGLVIAGVTLLSFGIAAWSRDYQLLIDDTEQKKDQYKQLSYTDALTKLANRAAYNKKIDKLALKETPFTLVLADLDHFKKINDNFGHDAGDSALKQVADIIKGSCRGNEECYRIGGEEFAILLTDCSNKHSVTVAERVRNAIEDNPVIWQGDSFSITASIGLCQSKPEESPRTTYRHADAALYEAKQNGRNQVVSAT